MQDEWTILQLIDGRGRGIVDERLDKETADLQAIFMSRMRLLMQLSRSDWCMPYAKGLKGPCKGLYEIRFKANKVQQRPMGFFGPEQNEFTFVFWAIEKNDKFKPHDACATALGNKDAIIEKKRQRRVLEIE